jgi:hypothetical protein
VKVNIKDMKERLTRMVLKSNLNVKNKITAIGAYISHYYGTILVQLNIRINKKKIDRKTKRY